MSKGKLFILAAASGTGKSSLINKLYESELKDTFVFSISHTTRKPRTGETNGKEYFFVTPEEFQEIIDQDGFIEHATVFGNSYGTSKQKITEWLEQGLNVFLDIDWQGAQLVRAKIPEAIGIFVLPPNIEELNKRLRYRKTDSEEVIQGRMQKAINEIIHHNEFTYNIFNDDLDVCTQDFINIILGNEQAEQHAYAKNKEKFDKFTENLQK